MSIKSRDIPYIDLVGGFNPSEKYELASWDDYSQYMESHKIPWFQSTNQIIVMDKITNPNVRCTKLNAVG